MDNRSVKIAAIEPSGRLYGSEYCLLDILRGTNSTRFDWTVITTQGSFANLLSQEESQPKLLPILPENLHLKSRWLKLTAYAKLFTSLVRLRPDVLYVNQAGILRISHLIARSLGINIACQVQTLEDAAGLSRTSKRYSRVYSFICNSRFIAEQTSVDAVRKCILYQGILTDEKPRQSPRFPSTPSSKLRLGILGRISPSKGHYLLAEAAKRLSEKGEDFSIRVIGDGLTAADTSMWHDYIRASGMQSFFDFRGYRTDLAGELQHVDLLLIPSIAEPLGRVLFDAAKHEVPVVVSDAGGLGEIASLYKVGIPFRSGNVASLVEAITHFSVKRESEIARFRRNSQQMLQSLSMKSYLANIEHILHLTHHGKPCNVVWLGDEAPAYF